jgi:ribonuclease HI
MEDRQTYIIYTDGACSPNPGPGGWGAVIIAPDKTTQEISGSVPHTTNNRMELTAAIESLKHLPDMCSATIFSDSKYLQQGITLWFAKWLQSNWQTMAGSDVQNKDLWKELIRAAKKRRIEWNWVKSHADNSFNNRADELARKAVPRELLPLTDNNSIHVYTSVSYSTQSKKGSWAVILRYREKRKVLSGTVEQTTSNRMHIHGALAGLSAIRHALPVNVYTFSGYLRDGLSRWLDQWEQHDWTTREGMPVKHDDLWKQLHSFTKRYNVNCYLADKACPPCEVQEAKLLAQEILAGSEEQNR